MKYLVESLETYLEDAASRKPAPGGGSVSALVGALAVAMAEMSANFTTGKKRFAPVEADIEQALQDLKACREELLELMQRDIDAYSSVGAAYGMPGKSEEEKAARAQAIQKALKEAMDVPLRVMEHSAQAAQIAEALVNIANPNLITDVGVSAVLAEAACAAARLNVEINLKSIRDRKLVEKTRSLSDELSERTRQARTKVTERVGQHLSD